MAYTIQVATEDCTGCGVCVEICPAKDKKNPRHKSLEMAPRAPGRDAERKELEFFLELPEDSYEAFLSVPLMCRGRVVGVINLQHRKHHVHRRREIRLISTIGFLVGAEIEMARLEDANSSLSDQLQTRKVVERAKGILQSKYKLSEEEAYLRLRNESRRLRRPMKDLADAIILAEDLSRKPDFSDSNPN